MSMIYRCNNCPAEVPSTWACAPENDGWIFVELHGQRSQHFCSWRCLAEYATARVLVDGATEAGP